MLLDDRLNDEDRHALHVAAQALRHVLDAAFREAGPFASWNGLTGHQVQQEWV